MSRRFEGLGKRYDNLHRFRIASLRHRDSTAISSRPRVEATRVDPPATMVPARVVVPAVRARIIGAEYDTDGLEASSLKRSTPSPHALQAGRPQRRGRAGEVNGDGGVSLPTSPGKEMPGWAFEAFRLGDG